MPASIEDLIGRVKSPIRSVTICLDAALQEEWTALSDQIIAAKVNASTMTGDAATADLQARLAEVENRMRASEQVFKFKGLSDYALADIEDRFPPRPNRREIWNVSAGSADLVAAAAVEPTMTVEQAKRLGEALARSQWDDLVGAAWDAATRKVSVPKYVRSSASPDAAA